MTAPTPSPEEFAKYIDRECWWSARTRDSFPENAQSVFDAIAARDAALLAPLREENALLRAEATAHMGVARAAEAEVARLKRMLASAEQAWLDTEVARIGSMEAEVARLREALRPFAEIAKGFNGDPSHDRDVFLSAVRPNAADWFAAARALAEGQT